jgi:hypothetical protein
VAVDAVESTVDCAASPALAVASAVEAASGASSAVDVAELAAESAASVVVEAAVSTVDCAVSPELDVASVVDGSGAAAGSVEVVLAGSGGGALSCAAVLAVSVVASAAVSTVEVAVSTVELAAVAVEPAAEVAASVASLAVGSGCAISLIASPSEWSCPRVRACRKKSFATCCPGKCTAKLRHSPRLAGGQCPRTAKASRFVRRLNCGEKQETCRDGVCDRRPGARCRPGRR